VIVMSRGRERTRRQRQTRRSHSARRTGTGSGCHADTGIADVDRLVPRGGTSSILLPLWPMFRAVTIGFLPERCGLIPRPIDLMVACASSTGRSFLTALACAFGLNSAAGDQYIALVLPTRIFRAEFARRGLAPTNPSRLTAESGTVASPLVPWNCREPPWAPRAQFPPSATGHSPPPPHKSRAERLYRFTGLAIEKVEPVVALEESPGRE
jgi:Na+:H+ antiporter, NhaC family